MEGQQEVVRGGDANRNLRKSHFGSTYTKIGMIQRRLAWPLCKDDTQIREVFHIFEGCHRSLWRNWSARSAVNRKAGGSSPPRDVGAHFPAGGDMSPWCLASWLIHSIMAPTLEGEDSSLFACLPTLMDCGTLLDCVWRLLFMSL